MNQLHLSLGVAEPANLSETEQAVALVHAGDLSIVRNSSLTASDMWEARVPNNEVRRIVLPHLLEKMYGLPPKCFSERTARWLADGRVGKVVEVFAEAWLHESKIQVSAREEKVHVFVTIVNCGIARALSELRARYPQILFFRGHILNEAGGAGRLDVAWTLKQADREQKDMTYIVEFKMVEDKLGDGGIDGAVSRAKDQVLQYATSLKKQRAGKQSAWVVVLSRSGALRKAVRVNEEASSRCQLSRGTV